MFIVKRQKKDTDRKLFERFYEGINPLELKWEIAKRTPGISKSELKTLKKKLLNN